MENTNSLPIRRAGSPVQVSAGPSTANFTPAVCSRVAMALVVFLARSSSAPAQPTQNRYSIVRVDLAVDDGHLEVEFGDPFGPAHLAHAPGVALVLQVAAACPRPRRGTPTRSGPGGGACPSMWSMCSMSTGHSSTHAPQLVQDQITSGSMTPPSALPTSGRSASALTSSGSFSRSSSLAASRYGALANAWSRRSRMTMLGRQRLAGGPGRALRLAPPALGAGGHVEQALPGEVLDLAPARTRRCPGRPPRSPAPCRCCASARSGPRAFGRRENSTFSGARTMCRCLE